MGQSRIDNPETRATLVTRHRMKKKQTKRRASRIPPN